jgi:hypothetical protein
MSNKTSFLGLSLLDTSSENSTHFKDWSRNINLEGDEDHKSDFQKIDEFAQKITKDLEERPAGVSSWNDLEDKPFGEIGSNVGDTLVWDGKPTDVFVENEVAYCYKISDSTPSLEQLRTGEIQVRKKDTQEVITYPLARMVAGNENFATAEIFIVIYKEGSEVGEMVFQETGVYFTKTKGDLDFDFNIEILSLTIPDYDFGATTVKKIDPKYIENISEENLSSEFQEHLKNLKPSASYNDLTNKPSIVLSVDDSGVLSLRVIHTEGTEPVEDFASYEKAENEDGEEIVGMTMNSTYSTNQINDKTLEVN